MIQLPQIFEQFYNTNTQEGTTCTHLYPPVSICLQITCDPTEDMTFACWGWGGSLVV